MESIKRQGKSKLNSIKMQQYPPQQNPIIRSKSKNIYTQQKHNKSKINSKGISKPTVVQKNNNYNNNPNLSNINMNYSNKNTKFSQKNTKNEEQIKNPDLIKLNLLKKENIQLKQTLIYQKEFINKLRNLLIHNFNKINLLNKQYSHYKRYLEKSIYDEDKNNLLKEKLEEEFALRAVEEQIMNEICPNPDQMSYEQLLQLEEEVGNVNKGLSKEKINSIPNKPFHKALFEDNCQCIICMENFSENELVKQLLCGHIFHGDCIDHWLSQQKNCPFCKADCIL